MNKKHLPGFSLASVIILPNFSEKSQKGFVWQQIETFDLNVVFNTSWLTEDRMGDLLDFRGKTMHDLSAGRLSQPAYFQKFSNFSPVVQLSLVLILPFFHLFFSSPSHNLFFPFKVSLKNTVNSFITILCLCCSSESWLQGKVTHSVFFL